MGPDPQNQQIEAGSPRGANRELQTGPYLLRTLLDGVPLSEDGDNDDININFVEFLGRQGPPSSPPSTHALTSGP